MSLDLPPDLMRRLGYQVTDMVVEHLAAVREQPAFTTLSRHEAERIIGGGPPETGREADDLFRFLRERVFANAAREPHPGFMAYVPSCPTFPAILGDWLAAGYNCFGGAWAVAAGPAMLELTVLDWFRGWLGLPAGAGGLLTSGGSAANVTATVAARHAAVGEEHQRLTRLVVYTSDQAHSSVVRAAWIAGIPREHVRLIGTDDEFRMNAGALRQAVAADRAAGLLPFMVVANAGSTNTGAVDPLPAIADLCRAEDLWFHVDAAYGGFAVLTDRGRAALHGIERADSITLDPHKWLFMPFECGCLLVREPARLKQAFQIFPEYLKDVEARGEAVNFADLGEQLSRYTRAIKVWLGVSYFGVGPIRSAIDTGMNLALRAEERVRATPGLELLSPARLGVVCFRARPGGMDDSARLDALNERINAGISAGGRYFISSTRLRGAYALRMCVLGFRTTEADVTGVVDEAARQAGLVS
ncbi:MAG: aspartate aminotransferase family protein [Gemmatimonadales bacterium]